MSERNSDEKRLLNEVLPDPERAAAELSAGAPRTRTAEHLRRLLAAGMTVPVAASALAGCASGPVSQQPPPPPPPPPYIVVDPPPPPPPRPQQRPAPGFLAIRSTPAADIEIDGKATGLKTPQAMIELTPGTHTVKLTAGPEMQQTFTIEIVAGATRSEDRDLRPAGNSK